MSFVSRCARALLSVNKVVGVRRLGEEHALFSTKSVISAKEAADVQAVAFYSLVPRRSSY